jgi:hypothetical protein
MGQAAANVAGRSCTDRWLDELGDVDKTGSRAEFVAGQV